MWGCQRAMKNIEPHKGIFEFDLGILKHSQ